MKKKTKKILWISLSIFAIIIVIIGIVGYNFYKSTFADEEITGEVGDIPATTGETGQIQKGEFDWPYWRGPNFNGKSNFTGIQKNWSNGLQKLWEVDYLCQGRYSATWSAPVVQGNQLIICGRDDKNDLVFCLNANNGELIWKGSYEAEAGTSHGPGSRATPWIDDDRVYTFGRSGDLVCWDLSNGKILWHSNVEDEGGEEPTWGHSSSPYVYKNLVFVQGGGTALVCAFDKMSGELIWKSGEGDAGYAAPALLEQEQDTVLLIFHAEALSGIEPHNGKFYWSVPWLTDHGVNATTPALYGDKIFITSDYGYGCMALTYQGTSVDSSWRNEVIASHHSDPVIIDGYIYGYSGMSGRNTGDFKCVELDTGKEMWTTDKVGWGTITYVDGHLICFDIKGNLYLVDPHSDKLRIVSDFKNAIPDVKTHSWTVPVFANGKLYVRYLQRLICYDLNQMSS